MLPDQKGPLISKLGEFPGKIFSWVIEEKDILIREARYEDLPETVLLLRKYGLHVPDPNNEEEIKLYYDRFWFKNPYYKMFPEPVFIGWIMEHQKKIAGFFSIFKRIYILDGNKIPVIVATQWAVEKEYRKFTYLLYDKFFNNSPDVLKIVTTAITRTGDVFEKNGGNRIPVKGIGEVYMMPLRLPKLVTWQLLKKIPALKPFSKLLQSAIRLVPWSFKYRLIKADNNFRQININQLPDDINELLDAFQRSAQGLIAFRNDEVFKWFYNDGKERKQVFIYTVNGITKGFASLVNDPVIENPELKRYKILELISSDEKTKNIIYRQIIKYAFDQKADILELHHPCILKPKDLPFYFTVRTPKNFPLFYQTKMPELQKILEDEKNWNIGLFDGDTAF